MEPLARHDSSTGPDLAVVTENHHDHRAVSGGLARAAVFGVSDGLVSNVSLVIGLAGSGVGPNIVRLTGLAGAIAGVASMAAGEWISLSAQNELVRREVAIERRELVHNPVSETMELAAAYRQHGMSPDTAEAAANEVMAHTERALGVHARQELGVDPQTLASPWRAAAVSLLCFLVGALLPVIPWFGGRGGPAEIASVSIGVVAAAIVGAAIGRFAERRVAWSSVRQVLILLVACAATFVIGSLIGVTGG
jgi:VIT1/CCC1 family predicted Fe2+/Mn2+ transporter